MIFRDYHSQVQDLGGLWEIQVLFRKDYYCFGPIILVLFRSFLLFFLKDYLCFLRVSYGSSRSFKFPLFPVFFRRIISVFQGLSVGSRTFSYILPLFFQHRSFLAFLPQDCWRFLWFIAVYRFITEGDERLFPK